MTLETAQNEKRKKKMERKQAKGKKREMGGVPVDRKKRSKYEAPGTSGRRRDGCPAVANSSAKMKRGQEGETRVRAIKAERMLRHALGTLQHSCWKLKHRLQGLTSRCRSKIYR